jgi:acyl-CoA synthetase (AMP-forming)/AMP-acid ligase II
MSPKLAKELSEILTNTQIYIMYGQTEATARITYLDPQDLFKKIGSIGRPISGVEVEILKNNGMPAGVGEEGEIVVKGKNVMAGYWNNQKETKKVLRKGKLYTGDIAKIDSEGYLYIVGRRSDMIKSGAHRISPKEIEEVIIEMNEIHEVAVVGIKDEILGEVIKAIIVLKDGMEIDPKKVKRHCQTKLALFKVPKEVIFVDELPKTRSGKVRRHLCKELTSLTCIDN